MDNPNKAALKRTIKRLLRKRDGYDGYAGELTMDGPLYLPGFISSANIKELV